MAGNDQANDKPPPLAIVCGVIGFLLGAALIGFVGWEAAQRADAPVPSVTVEPGKVHAAPGGFVVEFKARNRTAHTAAGVEVEATLETQGAKPVVSSVTLDYVPGHSTRQGGIFLPADPRWGQLELRAHGYSKP